MASAKVLRELGFYRGRRYLAGDVVEAPVAQLAAWEKSGLVGPTIPERQPQIERAEAPAPPESAVVIKAARRRGRLPKRDNHGQS